VKLPTQGLCSNCGYVSSNVICKACVLLEGLNRGRPKLAIGKSNKALAELLSERLDNAISMNNVQDHF
jgi:cytoplasmic tRNA 2-thiolation protein 1